MAFQGYFHFLSAFPKRNFSGQNFQTYMWNSQELLFVFFKLNTEIKCWGGANNDRVIFINLLNDMIYIISFQLSKIFNFSKWDFLITVIIV